MAKEQKRKHKPKTNSTDKNNVATKSPLKAKTSMSSTGKSHKYD